MTRTETLTENSEKSCEDILADQIFHDAVVTIEPDECTSEAGNQLVTETVADVVRCLSAVAALVHIAEVDRSDPHFPIRMQTHREVDGVPVTLVCTLGRVKNAADFDAGYREGTYVVCYETEVEFG